MKRTLHIMLLPLLVIVFFAQTQCSMVSADSLAFQVRLDKSEYLTGEVVVLHLLIVNLTDDTLHAVLPSYDAFYTVDLRLVDQSGNDLPNTTGAMFPRRVCQQDLLLPRDTLLETLDLSYSFNQRPLREIRHIFGQLPGRYTVTAATYLDRMTAAAVSYSVVEPKGSEAEAFALYRAVAEAADSVRWGRGADVVSRAEYLLGLYPRSVYSPQALKLMTSAYSYGDMSDDQKFIACCKRLIVEFPYHPECQWAFGRIISLQTLEKNRTYFQSIISSKSGTWAARVARNLLTRPWLERSSKGGLKHKN